MTDIKPDQVRLEIVDGIEYVTLRADDLRTTLRVSDALRQAKADENERLTDQVERLQMALAEVLESFTEPEDDNDILRRARAALGGRQMEARPAYPAKGE